MALHQVANMDTPDLTVVSVKIICMVVFDWIYIGDYAAVAA
jgi:hypothetical protein